MNHATHIANPFYTGRLKHLKRVAPLNEERDRPVYARLPRVPIRRGCGWEWAELTRPHHPAGAPRRAREARRKTAR